MNLHALAEERSLAYHRAVARRLRAEPVLIEVARRRVEEQLARRDMDVSYAREWQRALDGPLEDLLALLVDESGRGRALRQATPFAGMLPPAERWRLWREVRQELLP